MFYYSFSLIAPNDTDVVVLAIAFFTEIARCREIMGVIWNGQEIKVHFYP